MEDGQRAATKSDTPFADAYEHLELALAAARMGTWEWSPATGRVYWSQGLEAIHGLSPGAFDGRFEGFEKDIHPADREHVLATISATLSGPDDHYHAEYRIVCPDRSTKWLEARGRVLRDAFGEPVRMVGVCMDVSERKAAEAQRRHAEDLLAADAIALARMNEASSRLWRLHDLDEGLQEILSRTIELLGADKGNVQLIGETGVLRIAAQKGFAQPFLDFFREVGRDDPSACVRAIRAGMRVVVEDIEADPEMEALRPIFREAGCRAVQSTPLIGRSGELLGVLSTHFCRPHRPGEQDLRRLDLYARQATDFIERSRIDRLTRARARQQSAIAKLGAAALRESDLRKVLDYATALVAETLETDYCKVLELLPDGNELLLCAGVGWNDGLVGTARISARRGSQAGFTLICDEPVIVSDLKTERRFYGPQLLLEHGVASGMSCIIRGTEGRPWGVLGAHARREIAFTADDVNFLVSAANLLAYAIYRDRTEATLRRNEEQLRLATDAAEIGLWDVDNVAGTLFWPPRVKAMFGISPDAPVSMHDDFLPGLHPEDRARVGAAFAAAEDPERRALYDVEYRTIGKNDGVIRWVAAKGRGIFDARGQCVRVIGTAIDITERKLIEQRLVELNETLERRVSEALAERAILADIVEATDALIEVIDLDYRWLAINSAARGELERRFGAKPKVGNSVWSFSSRHAELQKTALARWMRALAGEQFTEIDPLDEYAEERRFYETKFNPLRDREGRVIGAYSFAHDVTERLRDQARLAQAEEHLRQAQKLEAVGQLTGGVAHDFNNLLQVISGGLSIIGRPQDPAKRERMLEGMRQAAERGASLTRQLLSFARRRPLKAEPTDLSNLDRSMRELLNRTLRGDVLVETRFAHDLWPVLVDPAELELAVLNLCANARDAMPNGGTITISAVNVPRLQRGDVQGDFVRLSVADTGSGMNAETRAHAFEPFFTTKEVGRGSGLGLPQVYGFARQSGGTAEIESAPGKGTTVALFLPRSFAAPSAAQAEARAEPFYVASGLVLLVEDDEEVAALVHEMLNQLGYDVKRASNAEAALRILADGVAIDVVLSDIVMPGTMNGIDLTQEIARRRPEIPVLLTSGYAKALNAEALGTKLELLPKPYTLAELAVSLQRAIGNHRAAH